MKIYSERISNRIAQLFNELQASCDIGLDFYDRLRELHSFFVTTTEINAIIQALPEAKHDFTIDWRNIPDYWPSGAKGYAIRWDAIDQMVIGGPSKVDEAEFQISKGSQAEGYLKLCEIYVLPLTNYILSHLEFSGSVLHILLRYKRWAEWFQATELRDMYSSSSGGEKALDENLRMFLFESGIDYPFSQPASPGGRVDVLAGVETQDPLVLEIKVWDSSKGYRENRVRDGFRQAIEYASKYGKDCGYIAVFNLDEHPVAFLGTEEADQWPSRINYSGRTYYFIDIQIAERIKPISTQDKGKAVRTVQISLRELLEFQDL
jgi:hypothetical protein